MTARGRGRLLAALVLVALGWLLARRTTVEVASSDGAGRPTREVRAGERAAAAPLTRGSAVADATDCGGPVRVVDAADVRVEGARVQVKGRYFTTDAAGEIYWAERPCGAVDVGVRWEDVEYPGVDAWIEDPTVLVVELPPDREAVVRFVDGDGVPVPVTVRRTGYLRAVERLDEAAWRVVGPRESATVVATGPDGIEQGTDVPLDGAEHDVLWRAARQVIVEGVCELGAEPGAACGWLRCGYEECDVIGERAYRCVCPARDARLYSPPSGDVVVPDLATVVRIDMRRGQATVTATWTGSLPCRATLRRGASRDGADGCGAAGDVVFLGVRPGAWLLEIASGDELGRRAFEVDGDGVVHVGAIGPGDEGIVPGDPFAEELAGEGLVPDTGDTGVPEDAAVSVADTGGEAPGGDTRDTGGLPSGEGDEPGGGEADTAPDTAVTVFGALDTAGVGAGDEGEAPGEEDAEEGERADGGEAPGDGEPAGEDGGGEDGGGEGEADGGAR